MAFWSTLGKIGSQLLQGVPILGGLIQGKMEANVSRENTDKTIAANKAMAEYQYSKDLEMWNRGNVYNSPQAQMERLKSAGLNPNMVYGSGSAAGMAAGQLPKYNAPTLSYNYRAPVDIPSMISQFQDFRIRNAQVRNTDAMFLGREIANELASETKWSKAQLIRDNMIMNRIKRDWARDTSAPGGGLRGQLDAQAQYLHGRVRNQANENRRIIEATRNLDLKNDYFAAEAISNLFGGAVRGVAGIGKMIQGGKAGKAVAPSILKDARKWQEFERAQRRNRWP